MNFDEGVNISNKTLFIIQGQKDKNKTKNTLKMSEYVNIRPKFTIFSHFIQY